MLFFLVWLRSGVFVQMSGTGRYSTWYKTLEGG